MEKLSMKKGFTLIELLIVLVIIGIIILAVLWGFINLCAFLAE